MREWRTWWIAFAVLTRLVSQEGIADQLRILSLPVVHDHIVNVVFALQSAGSMGLWRRLNGLSMATGHRDALLRGVSKTPRRILCNGDRSVSLPDGLRNSAFANKVHLLRRSWTPSC